MHYVDHHNSIYWFHLSAITNCLFSNVPSHLPQSYPPISVPVSDCLPLFHPHLFVLITYSSYWYIILIFYIGHTPDKKVKRNYTPNSNLPIPIRLVTSVPCPFWYPLQQVAPESVCHPYRLHSQYKLSNPPLLLLLDWKPLNEYVHLYRPINE